MTRRAISLLPLVPDFQKRISNQAWLLDFSKFVPAMERYAEAYDEFGDAIRTELDIPPLPPGTRLAAIDIPVANPDA